MNTFDKYLLLSSLSFFFSCMAIAFISLNEPSPSRGSYMYTPPQIEDAQSRPLEEAAKQNLPLPQSVLHYPGAEDLSRNKTVQCYLDQDYKRLIQERAERDGAALAVNAEMLGGDKLEIYTDKNGRFFAFVTGPDATNQSESCEVASGTGWSVLTP